MEGGGSETRQRAGAGSYQSCVLLRGYSEWYQLCREAVLAGWKMDM